MAKKAQMFVVTMVFLIGLVFTVQQLLFQYTDLDLSTPLRQNSIYLFKNAKGLINATIKSTPDCQAFSNRMEELKDFLESRAPSTGYSLSVDYRPVDCSKWNNLPPEPAPLNVTISILGKGSETTSTFFMYRW